MDQVRINIGALQEVSDLFSYPNNCHVICFLDQPLKSTVEKYLLSSIRRDGYEDSAVAVNASKAGVEVTITGAAAAAYEKTLPNFLKAGRLALEGCRRLHAAKGWRYNWRFFLPLGVALAAPKTVELLHFPPDYVLERDQDYLTAHTTLRWAELLVENGADHAETPAYQAIVDIAPIAAPSDDGKNLEGVYSFFTDYIEALLAFWGKSDGGHVRPMVAFGGPVRTWLKDTYKVDLSVLELGQVPVFSGEAIPTLAANHPSFIYNALKRLADDPNTPVDERVALLMRIMQQDLIAAAWQAEMGRAPQGDPRATLDRAKAKWQSPNARQRICELTYQQVFDKSPGEAGQLCANLPVIESGTFGVAIARRVEDLDERIAVLREEIGAKESTAPHQPI